MYHYNIHLHNLLRTFFNNNHSVGINNVHIQYKNGTLDMLETTEIKRTLKHFTDDKTYVRFSSYRSGFVTETAQSRKNIYLSNTYFLRYFPSPSSSFSSSESFSFSSSYYY